MLTTVTRKNGGLWWQWLNDLLKDNLFLVAIGWEISQSLTGVNVFFLFKKDNKNSNCLFGPFHPNKRDFFFFTKKNNIIIIGIKLKSDRYII